MLKSFDFLMNENTALAVNKICSSLNVSRHSWIIGVLDRASDYHDSPDPRYSHPRQHGSGNSRRIKLWVSDDRRRAYDCAADRCNMKATYWAPVMCTAAINASELSTQIDKARSGR